MKKSLIALAVLAASGATMAQSSVTLYGIADAYVGSVKDGLTVLSANPASKTVVNSSGLSTSRWGVRGTEDLGGGMKAMFNLEQGYKLDDGAAGNTSKQFDRQAWVGLSSDYGTVKLGRTTTAYEGLRALTNHLADTNLNVTNDVFKAAGGDHINRFDNMIQYTTPKWGAFSAGIDYSFGENKTATTSATNKMSLHALYAPTKALVLGYAYLLDEGATGLDTDYHLFAGSYDFGSFKITGGYNLGERDSNGTEDTEYQVGVSVPFGATALYLGYASAETETAAGVTTEKASGFAGVLTYNLSKRTTMYVGAKSVTEKTGAGVKVGKLTQTSVGVRHAF